MFLVDCAGCRQRRLVSVHRLRAMHNVAGGVIVVQLTCYCGHPTILLTGAGHATELAS